MNVCKWVEELETRKTIARDVLRNKMSVAKQKLKEMYDKKAVERSFIVGQIKKP